MIVRVRLAGILQVYGDALCGMLRLRPDALKVLAGSSEEAVSASLNRNIDHRTSLQ
jgi:hypothetical protein